MKRIVLIVIFVTFNVNAQQKIPFYIDYSFIGIDIGSSAMRNSIYGWFKVDRKDHENKWDVYKFSFVKNESTGGNRFKDMGYILETDEALNVLDFDFFNQNEVCINHKKLSINRIIFVKSLVPDKKKYRYQLWNATYKGTVVNILGASSYTIDHMLDEKLRKL